MNSQTSRSIKDFVTVHIMCEHSGADSQLHRFQYRSRQLPLLQQFFQ